MLLISVSLVADERAIPLSRSLHACPLVQRLLTLSYCAPSYGFVMRFLFILIR